MKGNNMDDPTKMTDEELKEVIEPTQLEETAEEEAPVASPQEETPAEEAPEEPTKEPEAQEESAPSRREQLRVQQLLKKYGPPKEPEQPAPLQTPNFRELINADDEVYETLDKSTQEAVDAARKAGESDTLKQLKSVQWNTLLHVDTPQVETKYHALNPKDEVNFRPALADAMNRRYLAMVGFDPKTGTVENPDIRYLDFVESEFELADEIASTQLHNTAKNIAKQAATTGLRPDGSSVRSMDLAKDPTQMTDDELKAAAQATMPRDARGRFMSNK
jgi:hypothetical protein